MTTSEEAKAIRSRAVLIRTKHLDPTTWHGERIRATVLAPNYKPVTIPYDWGRAFGTNCRVALEALARENRADWTFNESPIGEDKHGLYWVAHETQTPEPEGKR